METALLEVAITRAKGFVGSGLSFRLAAAFQKNNRFIVFVAQNAEHAAYYLNDLERLLSPQEVLFFPASYRTPYAPQNNENANVLLRSEVLNKVTHAHKARLVVTYPKAVFEKIISQRTLRQNTFTIKKEDVLSLQFVNESLFDMGFERVDFVTAPGEFAVRGGIIDVFSYAYQHPYRIDFFDETIERLCTFDIETQRALHNFDSIALLPNTSTVNFTDKRKTVFDFFPDSAAFVMEDFDLTAATIETQFKKATEAYDKLGETTQHPPQTLYVSKSEWVAGAHQKRVLHLQRSDLLPATNQLQIKQSPQPAFHKKFDLLRTHLNENIKQGYNNILFCTSTSQAQRFHDIFEAMEETVHYQTASFPIYQGFEDLEAKVAFFADHQIFERYHKYNLRSDKTKRQSLSLKQLTQMEVGDFVTHMDHGIGRFGGLQRIDVEGRLQEAIKLIYGERDILYLSIHALHKISKYNGKDGTVPKLHKLGSKAWKALKQKTKSKVKEIAFNLIQLYAKRRQKIGFAFAPDSYLQLELESSFLFEDTPDQLKATQAVKADMESEHPMDRLICGDVGFGKTEVAIRAAFKAVDNSKQVAVLVPTTILAFQHYKTFSKRLEQLPVRVDYLNRFRSSKDKTQIYHDTAEGKVDVLIGTHQLVNKNLAFKDLGLLIVDEEQKFGVAVKEKLRAFKTNVDVLTLTATPIPRTLQFSLMAARDLSVIATPPANRYPIESEVVRFSEPLIRDGVLYEIQRGGQVFFIHNRVENIQEVAGLIQRMVPDARIAIGHGQLEGRKLEQTLLDFMEGRYDVLVATTIIENGLDVPNANTIFINNAHQFGLSDLHQMRGRVGRSNKKAFCYFMTPPLSKMNPDAQKRIKAIAQYAELGSGLHIAMKDLEIRGAGDLLGGEQSGFINDMGFETYQKILQEAIDELKENEFQSVYKETEAGSKSFVNDVQIDTDLELYIPEYYINIVSERLNLYQLLSRIKTTTELDAFRAQLLDRFGKLPEETEALLQSVQLKWLAQRLGMERLVLKKQKGLAYFINNPESLFYNSTQFKYLLQQVQSHKHMVLKEKQTTSGVKLLLVVEGVASIESAIQALRPLVQPTVSSNS